MGSMESFGIRNISMKQGSESLNLSAFLSMKRCTPVKEFHSFFVHEDVSLNWAASKSSVPSRSRVSSSFSEPKTKGGETA